LARGLSDKFAGMPPDAPFRAETSPAPCTGRLTQRMDSFKERRGRKDRIPI
jgi:hypothetical protein